MIPHSLTLKYVFLYNYKYAKVHLLGGKILCKNKSNTINLTLCTTLNCQVFIKGKRASQEDACMEDRSGRVVMLHCFCLKFLKTITPVDGFYL